MNSVRKTSLSIAIALIMAIVIALIAIAGVGNVRIFAQSDECPTNPKLGDILECSIDAPAKMDTFTFFGNQGNVFLVRMRKISDSLSPTASIYRPDGTLLCMDYGPAISLTCTLDVSGTHSILLGDRASGTGSYLLLVQRVNDPANAIAVQFGEAVSGNLERGPDTAIYSFTGDLDDRVLVRAVMISGGLYMDVKVLGPDGRLVCSRSYSPMAEVLCLLTTAGTHTVLIEGQDSNNTGTIGLYVQRTNNPGNAVHISP